MRPVLCCHLISVFIFFILISPLPVVAQDTIRLFPWQIIQTDLVRIQYTSDVDLEMFYRQIRFGPSKWNIPSNQLSILPEQFKKIIGEKTDAVFIAASQILDMKKKFNPVNIHLYSNSAALKKAYENIYSAECHLRAWYRFNNNTIYLNVQDLHVGILAHELAHAIIDHFLTVRPPGQTAEILARYVDTHIEKGFR